MKSSKSLMDEDWDYLLILDACRYDYFKELYQDYFEGDLRKVISPASCTLGWCKSVFTGCYDDVIYVSGNPYINSKTSAEGFFGSRHFAKVIDVWESGWNKRTGTVHPEEIKKHLLKVREKFPKHRYIAHFMQPHAPYLSIFRNGENKNSNGNSAELVEILKDKFGRRWRSLFGPFLKRIIGNKGMWKIRKLLKLSPQGPGGLADAGETKATEAYEENLRIVLRCISSLLERIKGKVVITSDHGELLGEGEDFGHHPNASNKVLYEVPWLCLNEPEKDKSAPEKLEKGRLKSRIESLKQSRKI